jgi:hypothetical protein
MRDPIANCGRRSAPTPPTARIICTTSRRTSCSTTTMTEALASSTKLMRTSLTRRLSGRSRRPPCPRPPWWPTSLPAKLSLINRSRRTQPRRQLQLLLRKRLPNNKSSVLRDKTGYRDSVACTATPSVYACNKHHSAANFYRRCHSRTVVCAVSVISRARSRQMIVFAVFIVICCAQYNETNAYSMLFFSSSSYCLPWLKLKNWSCRSCNYHRGFELNKLLIGALDTYGYVGIDYVGRQLVAAFKGTNPGVRLCACARRSRVLSPLPR